MHATRMMYQSSQNYRCLSALIFCTFAGYSICRCSSMTITYAPSCTDICTGVQVSIFRFAQMCLMMLAVCVKVVIITNLDQKQKSA